MSAAVEQRVLCAASKRRASEATIVQVSVGCSIGAGFRYSAQNAPLNRR